MNWGYRILLLYLSFACFMGVMVFMSVTQKDIHLVAKDYYKQEIAYQNEINKITNAKQKGENMLIQYQAEDKMLIIQTKQQPTEGEILFFRPSDARKDFKIKLKTDENFRQFVPTQSLDKGLWKIKMNWRDKQKSYYTEKKIIVK